GGHARTTRRSDLRCRGAEMPRQTARGESSEMRRRLTMTGAALVILSGIGIGVAQALGSVGTTSNSGNLPPATTKVVKTTLMETKRVPGTLDYGDPVPIKAAGPGTLTWIAPVGSTVKRGGTLFKVDEQPIVALYGSVQLYRSLSVGEKGTDVRQLKQNL